MAQTIKLKRSAVQGVIPTTSQLELGEVAINTYDGKVYIKKNVGGTETIVEVGANATFTPAGSDGQLQFNNGGALGATAQVYYDDVNNRLGVLTSTPSYDLDVAGTAGVFKLQLDTSGTPVGSTMGELVWNTDSETADLVLNNGVVLQVGQENHFHVKAGEAISNGDVVYASGAVGNSGKVVVSKYIANGTIEERRVVGIATQDIALGEFGYVTSLGAVRGISTDGSALTTPEDWNLGDILYASPNVAGELTKTLPVAPNQAIAIAFVVAEHASNGTLQVRAYDLGYHIEELHDVHTSSVAGNDILAWSAANSRWENTDIPTLVDSRYVNVTGDTMTGNLTVPNLTLSNPGTGNTSLINFAKTSDTAQIRVTEWSSDATEFQFYMADNPSSTSDKFNWYMNSWQGAGSAWKPLEFSAYDTTINSVDTIFNGNLYIGNTPYISTGGVKNQVLESKSGTLSLSANVSAFTGSKVHVYIELTTDGSTFTAYNRKSTSGRTAYVTDVAITGAAQAITQGITVTFSGTTGGVAGDNWEFGAWGSGQVNVSTEIAFADNAKAVFGAGDDLQIYHDGSNSWISEVGTGSLIVAADNYYLRNAAGTEVKISAISDGSVSLYDNNSVKLATTSSGVNVTGTVVSDGLTVDGAADINGNITVSGALTFDGPAVYNAINLNNNSVIGVNNISFADPGPSEGLFWSNIKIYESPDDLTTNSSGNLQVVYGNTRRLTVNNTGIDVNGEISSGNITTSGYLRGPATFTIDPAAHGDDTGTVVIAGNLQVDGTTTTINSTTVQVDDKNIELAVGSINKAAADGAGITIDCGSDTDATLLYDGINDWWEFNKPLESTRFLQTGSVASNLYAIQLSRSGTGTTTPDLWGTNNTLVIGNSASNAVISIDSSSNVGIGTVSPFSGTRTQICGADTSPTLNTAAITDASLILSNSDNEYGTVFATDSSGKGYIQQRRTAVATYYDLLIQPYGGTVALGTATATDTGKLHVYAGYGDQTASPDSASLPSTTGTSALSFDGAPSYQTGQYRTRFAKIDRSANLPLYVQESKGTANSYSNLARFGSHSQSDHEFQVFGSARAEYFSTSGGTIISLDNENWAYRPHDIVYNGWRASTGDYTYLKAAGNSNDNHGIAVVADNAFYVGITNNETGALADNATNPITTTWAYVNSTGLTVNGQIDVDSQVNIAAEAATLATTTQTQIASFSATTYGGGKFVITATDGSNRHICEILVTHNGTTAIATQYGSVYTATELATYDVDISGGNVRILATSSSINSTVYKVAETLIRD